jgi:hypothetical protein
MSGASLLGLLLIAALQGGIACAITQSKNRSGYTGFVTGALLGIIGIIIVLCLPKIPARTGSPGWYPDPLGRCGSERYWDGRCWDGRRLAPPLSPMPPSAVPPLPPGEPRTSRELI